MLFTNMLNSIVLSKEEPFSIELKENIKGGNPKFKTQVDILLNDLCLKLVFKCSFITIKAEGLSYNQPLYDGDIVEALIMTKDFGRYLEIEVNPNNIQYLVQITNDGENIKIDKLDNTLYSSKVEKLNNTLVYTIDINLLQLAKLNVDISATTFNLHRQQFFGEKLELSSLSPTYCERFHKIDKFANLTIVNHKRR